MTKLKICSEDTALKLELAIRGEIMKAEQRGEAFQNILFSTAVADGRRVTYSAMLLFKGSPAELEERGIRK